MHLQLPVRDPWAFSSLDLLASSNSGPSDPCEVMDAGVSPDLVSSNRRNPYYYSDIADDAGGRERVSRANRYLPGSPKTLRQPILSRLGNSSSEPFSAARKGPTRWGGESESRFPFHTGNASRPTASSKQAKNLAASPVPANRSTTDSSTSRSRNPQGIQTRPLPEIPPSDGLPPRIPPSASTGERLRQREQ